MCSESGSLVSGLSSAGASTGSKLLLVAGGLGQAGLGTGGADTLPLANAGDLLLRGLVGGVDLGGMEELGQRALEVAGGGQLAPFGDVRRGSGDANAGEGDLEARVFRVLAVGLLIEVEGGVVVFAGLGGLAVLVVGVGRLGMKPDRRQAEGGQGGKDREGENDSRHGDCGAGWRGCSSGLCGRAIHTTPRR